MAFADTVKFTAGSSGTSDFSDGTALTGFRSLSTGAVSGQTYSYRAFSADLSQWENGQGVYTSGSPGTLARTTQYETSTGSKVSFTTAPVVILTPLAADYNTFLTTQDRRNALLMLANQSKALASSVRVLETFADGYKASDGINSGSSSNYTLNTTSGYVGPSPATTTVFLTSGTSWSVPSGVSNLLSVEAIGGGGGGAGGNNSGFRGGGGGGGGAYAKITNLAVTPLASITYAIGSAGTAGTTAGNGGAGGDTYFNGANFAAASLGAKGGSGGLQNSNTAVQGGQASASTGTTKFNGGSGGIGTTGTSNGGFGGGGAGGPLGAGGNGGSQTVSGLSPGTGGGGNGGGSNGTSNSTTTAPMAGTAGGNNNGGTGSGSGGATTAGAGGANGSNGGGGGGASFVSANQAVGTGGTGGSGTEWDSTHGSGGGGGGGGATSNAASAGGAGGTYGGGGGGGGENTGVLGAGGAGGQGLIVITYSTSFNNMTLVTTSQTADASVSHARALVELNEIDSITLGTDLTIETTCDGGTHWTAAGSYTDVGAGQGGNRVVETDDMSCTPGTSFAARIKTLNNKNVDVYKAAIAVH